jgi:hypothetical protein
MCDDSRIWAHEHNEWWQLNRRVSWRIRMATRKLGLCNVMQQMLIIGNWNVWLMQKTSMATRYSCMINARKQCEQWTLNIKQQSKQEESTLQWKTQCEH